MSAHCRSKASPLMTSSALNSSLTSLSVRETLSSPLVSQSGARLGIEGIEGGEGERDLNGPAHLVPLKHYQLL